MSREAARSSANLVVWPRCERCWLSGGFEVGQCEGFLQVGQLLWVDRHRGGLAVVGDGDPIVSVGRPAYQRARVNQPQPRRPSR